MCRIFSRPAFSHIADTVLLYLDVASLNTVLSVSPSWNNNVRNFISRKFLKLEDLAILPAMTDEYTKQRSKKEYKKQHNRGKDNIEEMETKLVCYHAKAFESKKVDKIIKAGVKILPKWKNIAPKDVRDKEIIMGEFKISVNTSLKLYWPACSLHHQDCKQEQKILLESLRMISFPQ